MMIYLSWCKIDLWFSFFSIFSSDIPLDFHKWIQVVLPNYLMYPLAGTNTKELCNFPEKKRFCSIKSTKLVY